MDHGIERAAKVGFAALLAGTAATANAQADLVFSTDSTYNVSSITPAQNEIARTDRLGTWAIGWPAIPASLPPGAAVDAYSEIGGLVWYSADVAYTHPTLGAVASHDIVLYDNAAGTYALAFDGSAAGIPAGADLDALDVTSPAPLQFSFSLDRAANLPGVGIVEAEDMARWNGAGFDPALTFDGSAEGIPPGANLVGFSEQPTTDWIMSFDRGIVVASATFDQTDALIFQTALSTFSASPYFDGSAQGVPAGADVQSLETFDTGPLLIDLVSFEVNVASDGAIPVLNWTTASEIDNAGFHIWRARQVGGYWLPDVRLTDTLLAAEGSEFEGASYAFLESDPYFFGSGARGWFLQDVEFDGTTTLHGPTLLDFSGFSAHVPDWSLMD